MTTTLTVSTPRVKSPNETRLAAVSFSGCLDSGETLTGTPAIDGSPSGLTITSKAVSGSELNIDGVDIPAGEAVTFLVAGGTAGQKYTITIAVGTSASQSLERFVILQVAGS